MSLKPSAFVTVEEAVNLVYNHHLAIKVKSVPKKEIYNSTYSDLINNMGFVPFMLHLERIYPTLLFRVSPTVFNLES